MKKFLLLALWLLTINDGLSQQKLDFRIGKTREIVCPAPDFSSPYVHSYVAPPELFLQKFNKHARTEADKSQFIVTYINFPENAKAAFQRAVDIWQSIIISDVPIRITASWESLGSSVLGSAYSASVYRDYAGAQYPLTWYPIALAEKIAHTNLNSDNPDIFARFNSDFTWYYGIDGNTPTNRADLVSVVLHEIGHGLGFYGTLRQATSDATLGVITDGGIPMIYDIFAESTAGQRLLNTNVFKNPSVELKTQLTGGNLYLNSPTILANNDSLRAKVYAPSTYQESSSYSHLDESSYRRGTINALMTPQIANGEVTHNPGPITLALFNDMGWVGSSIIHKKIKDSEDNTKAISFNTKVYGDLGFDSTSVKLFYTLGDITKDKPIQVSMSRIGNSNEYTYVLPASTSDRNISYYFSAVDSKKKTFSTPAQAPGTLENITYYKFKIGADTTKPVLDYTHNLSLIRSSELEVSLPELLAYDNIDIDTAYVEYLIDGKAQSAFALKRTNQAELASGAMAYAFSGKFTFASGLLKGGENIQYRIVVKDKSKAKNTAYSPSNGYYEFRVQKILTPVNSYITNFDNIPTDDFYTKGFGVAQPTGFTSKAMHSDHPYKDGTEFAFTETDPEDKYSNFTFNLQKPIILRSDTAKIYFDEIVLVEPGDNGVSFATGGVPNRNFFDYVIVEGSKDGGITWKWFQDGWDSNTNSTWKAAWNASVDSKGNSLTNGSQAMFKAREIDMLKSGDFKAGDQVLIRFRLLADVGANGWGWAVDNLNIQGPNPNAPKVIVLGFEFDETQLVNISPNPSTNGQFLLKATFEKPANQVKLDIIDITGKEIANNQYEGIGTQFSQVIDLSKQASGTYILRMVVGDKVLVKKLITYH
ncbi:T9SS type A sorting domain-containing protein [Flectobacillus sp. DC10W]|uniref:T9SS type A sorting domain-containing protein n=1 Tax=Flectobacillus longus TaxID=2984207 RepID=A0ABT6YMW1_9BACT|nr:T9SS type A sorting domain-containing protein [Flectobacillus longus]MDI9864774.1 T9SS type A sorting domain-containing protein [Flectobacillus longus]